MLSVLSVALASQHSARSVVGNLSQDLLWSACRDRLDADLTLLEGDIPVQGCASLPAESLQELWDAYYAPGVLENATEDPGAYRELLLGRFMALHPLRSWMEAGPFLPEDLDAVHTHWLSYPPQHPLLHFTLAAAYFVIMTLGVFGNLLVLYMFCRCRSLRSPANILIANLAISDFFLLAKMPVFIYNSLYLGPVLGQMGSDIYGFVGGLTGTVSIATLAAIALDRYHVIVQPLDPGRRISRLRARLCVAVTWVYGTVFASCPLNGLSRYTPEGLLTSSSFDYLSQDSTNRIFIFCFFFAAWVIPFCIITLSYFGIYRIVEHATQKRTGTAGSGRHCREHDKRRTEVRLAWVAGIVVALWFTSWTPYAVVALMGVFGRPPGPLTSMLPALFCKTASCLDPYVYAVTHPRFRRELSKLLGWVWLAPAPKHPTKMRRTRCWRTNTSITSAATAACLPTTRRGSASSADGEVVHISMTEFRRQGDAGEDLPHESVCSSVSTDSPPFRVSMASRASVSRMSRGSSSSHRGEDSCCSSSRPTQPPPQAARMTPEPACRAAPAGGLPEPSGSRVHAVPVALEQQVVRDAVVASRKPPQRAVRVRKRHIT